MSARNGAVRPRSGQRLTFIFRLLDWLTAVTLCVGAAALLLFVVWTPVSVKSSGVSDFYPGDLVFADKLSKHLFGFSRGDAVVLRSGRTGDGGYRLHIARVAAFQSEKVVIADGRVYIGNALLDESAYAEAFDPSLRAEFIVPTGSIFVLPDERSDLSLAAVQSYIVPLDDVAGEVRLTAFPITRLKIFR